MSLLQKIENIWTQIYGNEHDEMLHSFVAELQNFKQTHAIGSLPQEWYREVTVYSLYVDLFNHNFQGLEDKLDYLQELGVSCLWLLPILDSPGRDAGFDIKDYRKIRPDLLSHQPQDEVFDRFLQRAHEKGIRVIFDIAINHVSEEHPWFAEARKSKDNAYRNYFHWSPTDKKYEDARIIFYGIEESNWKKEGDEYFFHRFFDFQPDLNYENPQVFVEMTRNLMYWMSKGVDGFRADAIPYLWKEEGTACENHPNTHRIVKLFRAAVDFIRPNTLLLAEACQQPVEVVKYFGDGDECHAGYHFPLMPQLYKALELQSAEPITHTLSQEVTPQIPQGSQWFTFLRCHDELSLELVYVTEEDRKFIHDHYCKNPEWNFRLGQGISARFAELMDNNVDKIALMYSIMLSLPGTPVVYYGDEFGKQNDHNFYKEQIQLTGKDDTRFLVRGRIDWEQLEKELAQPESLSYQVYHRLSRMLKIRSQYPLFGRGDIQWIDTQNKQMLMYQRSMENEKILVVQNLSNQSVVLEQSSAQWSILTGHNYEMNNQLSLNAYGFVWAILK